MGPRDESISFRSGYRLPFVCFVRFRAVKRGDGERRDRTEFSVYEPSAGTAGSSEFGDRNAWYARPSAPAILRGFRFDAIRIQSTVMSLKPGFAETFEHAPCCLL